MSNEEKQKDNKDSDRSFIYFMLIWFPIMMIFFISPLLDSDPNSLLTDDQKLEKQKDIAEAKEIREQEWEDQMKFYDDGWSWFVYERPFPFNILIGMGIFFIVAWGLNQNQHGYGYDRHRMYERFLNPSVSIPLTIGLFYLLWVSGELENLGII